MPRSTLLIVATVVIVLASAGIWFYASESTDGGADPADRALVSLGERAYVAQCASCHGRNLEGQPNWRQRLPDGTLPAPPHDETGHTWHHSDKVLFDITKYGGQQGMRTGFKSAMPGFADKLSDREINAVLAYIKSRWPEPVQQRQALINARSR